jgi:ABC-type multidrug transport system fused ATPase/permease subunit
MNPDVVSELDRVPGALLGGIPALLLALLVLVVGWLAALWLASLVRSALMRTTLDDEMAAWVDEDERAAPPRRVEVAVGRLVFWLAMAGVLVVFLRILGLSHAVEPLGDFLSELVLYLPGLLAAVGVALLAWVVATVLRAVLRFGLERLQFDRRVGGGPTAEVEDAVPSRGGLTASVADALYWLVFLLFLPAVLSALGIGELLGPVRKMFQAGLGYVPNLLSALLLLALGWLVARISQKLVTNLAGALGADRLGRPGAGILGRRALSGVIGLVVYVLVLVPVLIASLNALGVSAVTEPATALLQRFLVAIPRLFAAALVVVIAYVVGRLVAGLGASLLAAAGFDSFLARLGLLRSASAQAAEEGNASRESQLGDPLRRRPSELIGYALLVAMMLFAAIQALTLLEFELLASMLGELSWFLADVGLGLLIFAAGVYFASLAARAIRSSGAEHSTLFAAVAEGAILVLAVALALRQIGLPEDLINLAFGLLLGAVAVAAAIAFGFGGRELAARYLAKWVKELEDRDS